MVAIMYVGAKLLVLAWDINKYTNLKQQRDSLPTTWASMKVNGIEKVVPVTPL